MIANEQVPRGKGVLQIFAFFLLAMVGGFVGGELSKANMLTSSVPPPRLAPRSAAQGPWMSPRAARLEAGHHARA